MDEAVVAIHIVIVTTQKEKSIEIKLQIVNFVDIFWHFYYYLAVITIGESQKYIIFLQSINFDNIVSF